MPRILIVGGYGAFGMRAAERLAREADFEIIVAGRSGERARACAVHLALRARATVTSAVIDAERVSASDLMAFGAAVVVNASGPFQAQDYHLARACIAARCHYVDLADARAFVTGIGLLDTGAKAAGVAIISGASSVPGVSSAVVAHLGASFARISAIEIAISPGSGFEPGEATAAAGLSYLGRAIRVPGRPRNRVLYGWQGLQRLHFPGLGRRWTGYCDVPDLDLFAGRYPDLERTEFRAGLEVSLFQIGLWLLSWPARVGLIAKPERMARALTTIKSWFSFLGTNRGGMRVAVHGTGHDGQPLTALWSLAAEQGDGLFVPTIASVILARRLARGTLAFRGASPCFQLFGLDEFLTEISGLRIAAGPRPLYQRLLGARYGELPAAVARLHDVTRRRVWRGAARVEHGPSLAARLAAWLMPFPRQSRGEEAGFSFEVRPDGDAEIWSRGFANSSGAGGDSPLFRSRQFEHGGRLIETVKGLRFVFGVEADASGQRLVLERLSVLGVPVPRALHPVIRTLESDIDGRYQFEVETHLPLGAGLLVRYAGWLAEGGDNDA